MATTNDPPPANDSKLAADIFRPAQPKGDPRLVHEWDVTYMGHFRLVRLPRSGGGTRYALEKSTPDSLGQPAWTSFDSLDFPTVTRILSEGIEDAARRTR